MRETNQKQQRGELRVLTNNSYFEQAEAGNESVPATGDVEVLEREGDCANLKE